MKHGFIKVATVCPHIRVGDTVFNADEIISKMAEASEKGVKIAVFPELCITSYTCGDLFFQTALLKGAKEALKKITLSSKGMNMLTFVGVPLIKDNCLYNCAVAIFEGMIYGVIPKTSNPNYSEFYEKRHFSPAPKQNSTIEIDGASYKFGTDLLFKIKSLPAVIGAEICEDLWIPSPPSVKHCEAGANLIVNLSASNEAVGKDRYRRDLVKGHSARLVCGYIYSSAGEGESTTDLTFGGHSIIAENGELLSETKIFENQMAITEIDVNHLINERIRMHSYENAESYGYETIEIDLTYEDTTLTRNYYKTPFVPADTENRKDRCEYILSMQTMGLKKRIEHTMAKSVVIGVSGGLDSTLALLVAVRTFDRLKQNRKEIVAVTMPSFGTTSRTKNNANKLAQFLGVTLKEVDITKAVNQHFKDICHDGSLDVTFENAQARERTQVLMDIANQMGGLVVGTGDLSELALGWATYNGDHMSMYGVNAGIPKTLVRHLVQYEADRIGGVLKEALYDVLDTPVSPELLPPKDGEIAQKTEDLVGPYELHDFFLYYGIRFAYEPSKVYRLAAYAFKGEYDENTILKWLKVFYRRFFASQFKRSCLPDGPKVGSVSLSPRGDWRMPSDAMVSLWMNSIDNL